MNAFLGYLVLLYIVWNSISHGLTMRRVRRLERALRQAGIDP